MSWVYSWFFPTETAKAQPISSESTTVSVMQISEPVATVSAELEKTDIEILLPTEGNPVNNLPVEVVEVKELPVSSEVRMEELPVETEIPASFEETAVDLSQPLPFIVSQTMDLVRNREMPPLEKMVLFPEEKVSPPEMPTMMPPPEEKVSPPEMPTMMPPPEEKVSPPEMPMMENAELIQLPASTHDEFLNDLMHEIEDTIQKYRDETIESMNYWKSQQSDFIPPQPEFTLPTLDFIPLAPPVPAHLFPLPLEEKEEDDFGLLENQEYPYSEYQEINDQLEEDECSLKEEEERMQQDYDREDEKDANVEHMKRIISKLIELIQKHKDAANTDKYKGLVGKTKAGGRKKRAHNGRKKITTASQVRRCKITYEC